MTQAMQPRDRLIPWYFVAFFVVIAVIDGTMVTVAVRTQTGIVTEHPYEKGLAYNDVVTAESDQEKLGWKGTVDFKNTSSRNGVLSLNIKDTAGKKIIPDSASAVITRPTQAGMDFTVTLQSGDTPVTFPASGLWEIRIYALQGKNRYQQAKRIVVE